jgi:LPS sulfotransferase NodH
MDTKEASKRIYVICTNPRSGSTLLCRGLATTGLAGAPNEFFGSSPETISYWMAKFRISAASDFADKIAEATSTSNGVFGTKLHRTEVRRMRGAMLESLSSNAVLGSHPSLDALLKAKFCAVDYIWLRRRNKVAQGISHFRAVRTDVWEVLKGGRTNVERVGFDLAAIDHCVKLAEKYEAQWADFFTRWNLRPLLLTYEDLATSYDASLRSVLTFLGLDHRSLPRLWPSLERLADEVSLEWEERYRRQAGRYMATAETLV